MAVDRIYDFAPLMWWQDPWWLLRMSSVGIACAVFIAIIVWYRARRRRVSIADRWQRAVIERLKSLAASSLHHDDMLLLVECLKVIAVFERYVLYRPESTDTEFLELVEANNSIPDELHTIFKDIFRQATEVKFARGVSDVEKTRGQIHVLIAYLQKELQS